MEDQEESTLEFQGEAELDTLTRQAFRIPVHHRDHYTIVGGNQALEMYDISMSGSSISVTTPVEWQVDTPLEDWTMNLGDESITSLDGRVIHCTPSGRGEWITGIQWANIPPDRKPALETLLYSLRQELFESE